MIEALLKLLSNGQARVVLQFGTFLAIVIGAAYFGAQTRDFVIAQQATADNIKQLDATVSKLNADKWSYSMQRDYNAAIQAGQVPNISEIREKHIYQN